MFLFLLFLKGKCKVTTTLVSTCNMKTTAGDQQVTTAACGACPQFQQWGGGDKDRGSSRSGRTAQALAKRNPGKVVHALQPQCSSGRSGRVHTVSSSPARLKTAVKSQMRGSTKTHNTHRLLPYFNYGESVLMYKTQTRQHTHAHCTLTHTLTCAQLMPCDSPEAGVSCVWL